jgi:hypothetical protein
MSDKKTYDSFSEEVWDTLSRIDVSDHIGILSGKNKDGEQKRPDIEYVPWHRAWTLLKRHFPASTYLHGRDLHHEDGTVEVFVEVAISRDGGEVQLTSAQNSVMDGFMRAMKNPNARDVNDARQRCLVKALAFAGLGLNLWGDDMTPVGTLDDPLTDEQMDTITDLIEKTDTDDASFLKWCGCEAIADMSQERYPSARSLLESKLRRKQKADKLEKEDVA